MSKAVKFVKDNCPRGCYIFYLAALLAGCVHLSCIIFPKFADFFVKYIAGAVRAFLAMLTGFLPFSLAETVVVSVPVLVLLFMWWIIFGCRNDDKKFYATIFILLSLVSFLYFISTFSYGMGYHTTPLSEKLSLEQKDVSAEELYETALKVLEESKDVTGEIKLLSDGSSVMPYSLEVMNDKLNEAYIKASEKYGFLPKLSSRIKYIALSEPMTYTHISGVYAYYTGEANLNINFPDYNLPYTAAHEMAHQRGIAPENEANFVAFLVCMESDDPYIRYSAYVNMYEYLSNALYSADYDLFEEVYGSADVKIRKEMTAYNEFFKKYQDNTASKVTDVINDTYLKTNGQKAGTQSYGLVVDLCVAYYKNR